MTNPLHDAAMAAKRFHDAALAYLDDPTDKRLDAADKAEEALRGALLDLQLARDGVSWGYQ